MRFLPFLILAACNGLAPYQAARDSLPDDEFVEVDGRWVHFQRRGSGPTLLLVHGYFASTFSWRNVMPALAESFDVVAIDLNGFGYTERPVGKRHYTVDGQVELLTKTMDALDIGCAHVLGHSYGATVALTLAERDPKRVDRLIVVDGVPSFGGPNIPGVVQPVTLWYMKNAVTVGWTRRWLDETIHNKQVIDDAMAYGYWEPLMLEGLDNSFYGLADDAGFVRADPDWARIGHRTLVLWGRHDKTFSLEHGQDLALKLEDATMLVLDDAGHLPFEDAPQPFADAVGAFLKAP